MSTDRPTIKGCEPWGGIEVLPAIFSRVVLANFSVTGKLDGLFQGPRSGNLQFQNQKKNRFHPRGINIIIIIINVGCALMFPGFMTSMATLLTRR